MASKKKSKRELKKRSREIKKARRAEIRGEKLTFGQDVKLFWSQLGDAIGGYDYHVVALVMILSVFGIIMVFSAGYYQTINTADPDPLFYLTRQMFFVVVGWLIMFFVANLDYHSYTKLSVLFLLGSIALLVLVMLIGSTSHNAQRWISIAGIRITPSELSKLFVIIFTATFLAHQPKGARSFVSIAVLVVVMAVHFVLIIMQPNLSTAVVVVMIIIALMIVAGLPLILLVFPIAGVGAGYYYIMNYATTSHWYQRLTSFMDPFADRQGDGYQVTQGLIALGNGGLKGVGLGNSIQKNMYLPEPTNDFILAIIGEELGFIGFVILMLLYILLLYYLVKIAMKARDKLGFYLATGVAVMLGLQVVINVAVVTSSMPVTGITLPFISYGGTSMWVFMGSMGMALNVSKKGYKARKKQSGAEEENAEAGLTDYQPELAGAYTEGMVE